jgi:hypothetical protein
LATAQERKLIVMLTKECNKAYLSYQLISEKDLREIMRGLEDLIDQRGTLIGFPKTTQICAFKNS